MIITTYVVYIKRLFFEKHVNFLHFIQKLIQIVLILNQSKIIEPN